MFQNGSLVTLVTAKLHGEGNDAVKLQAGVCGMVVRGDRKKDGNHLYTIDFGAYGAWYCLQNELSGDDVEGWDGDQVEQSATAPDWTPVIPQGATASYVILDEAEDTNEDEEDDTSGMNGDLEPVNWDRFFNDHPEENPEDYTAPKIDLEKDIQRRMKEIEKGNCYDTP